VIMSHAWPGNIRELENLLERAIILTPGDRLVLPPDIARGPGQRGADTLADAVRRRIEEALASTAGQIYGPNGAAALLGLPPTTLQSKMRRPSVKRPPPSRSGGGPRPKG
jgi:transcriptional regulator of acetoin/glycerol metabolism